MKEFFKFPIAQPMTVSVALTALKASFAEFVWRQGDSDMQGPYIWGRSNDGVRMKLWLGEDTPVLTISFNSFEPEAADRGPRLAKRLESIKATFSATVAPLTDQPKAHVNEAAE